MNYPTLVVDPPWRYPSPGWKGGAENHYDTLPVDALLELPVNDVAPADAHLWLWVVEHTENSGDVLRVLDRWGFEPKARFPWIKLAKTPIEYGSKEWEEAAATHDLVWHEGNFHKIAWGNGFYGRSCTETVILATRGKNLCDDKARQVRKILYGTVGEHSEKPSESYNLIAKYSPGPRLDVFSRRRLMSFDSWGRECSNVELPAFEEWSRWAEATYQTPPAADAAA